jgi:xylulokinase
MSHTAPVLLGVDLGTSGGRAVLFDLAGQPVSQAVRSWAPRLPRQNWAELDAEIVWLQSLSLMREACARAGRNSLAGIGISAQLTTLLLDGRGDPAFPVLPWLDRRAEAEAQELEHEAGRGRLAEVAGRRAAAERPAAIARWIQRHEPAVWARTHTLCTLKDFLVRRLTGNLATDESNASYSLLFDVRAKRWDAGLCALADISPSKLPDVLPACAGMGTLREEVAREIGVSSLPIVAAGGPDGTLASVGAGLIQPGDAVDVGGTTDVVFACLANPKVEPTGGLVTNVYACPDRWVLGGPTTTTGGALAWAADQVYQQADFDLLIREAAEIPAGADGVRCSPALSGERTPVWDPRVRAAFVGLGLEHRRAHLVRAILEASACVVRRVVRAIEGCGERVKEMRLVGGAAESELWAQIRADLLGIPIRRMAVRHASALGAAILAGVGADLFPDVETAAAQMGGADEVLQPNPVVRDCYDGVYADFERIQSLLQAFARGSSCASIM